MSWVAVAVGVGTAATKGVQANQERQRQKGVIGKAFGIAGQRQKLAQTDVRTSQDESLGRRGLTQGGGVSDAGPVGLKTPSVTGAHTLGEQANADLGREQSLEAQDLEAKRSASLSDINAAANEAEVGGVASGIGTGFELAGALHSNVTTTPGNAGTPGAQFSGEGAQPYGGIDPNNPLNRGTWAGSNSDFTFGKNG